MGSIIAKIVKAANAAWPYIWKYGKEVGKIVVFVIIEDTINRLRKYADNRNNPDSSEAATE